MAYSTRSHSRQHGLFPYVLTGLNFQKQLTVKAKEDFDSQFNQVSKLEFTEQNIRGFLNGLQLNQSRMLDDVMLELFDKFTGYYPDNRSYYKSWKSNEKHKHGAFRLKTTRVVIPMSIFESWSDGISCDGKAQLIDIDKAMAALDNKNLSEINGLSKVINSKGQVGQRMESDYFDVRLFMNGNVHLFPKHKHLIEKLNKFVGKSRQWLPEEDTSATVDFWNNYKSDKTTKDIEKAKLNKSHLSPPDKERFNQTISDSLKSQGIDENNFVNRIESATPKLEKI